MEQKNDKKDFEKELKAVFSLRKEISEEFDIASGFLTTFHKRKKRRKIRALTITSTAAAAIIVSFLTFSPLLKEINSDQLYTRFYTQFDPDVITRDNDSKTELDYGILSYKTGDIDLALEIFNKSDLNSPNNLTYKFYQSLALIDNGEYDLANTGLEELRANGDFMLSEVYWYLILINLRGANHETVRRYIDVLRQIAPKAHSKEIRSIKRNIRFR